jgi:large subunit ribosomal protein L20
MHALKVTGIDLDRKVLADMAMHEGEAFRALIAQIRGNVVDADSQRQQQAAA